MADNIRPPLDNSSFPRDKELEKLLKWQKDRMEKRLRGEHESAVVHLSQVVSPNILCFSTRTPTLCT